MDQQQEILSRFLKDLQLGRKISKLVYQKGKQLFEMGHCHLMFNSSGVHEYLVKDDYKDFHSKIIFNEGKVNVECSCMSPEICSHGFAVANQTFQDLSRSVQVDKNDAIKYSRDGMMKRVKEERELRAQQENYIIDYADNIYGEHHLTNDYKKNYKISFYDFEKKLGYCSCPDYQTNKLETCKHLIYAFNDFAKKNQTLELPNQIYPFLEIFRHPQFDYQISWFYPHTPTENIQIILNEYFDKQQLYLPTKLHHLHLFLEKVEGVKSIKIRPEVKTYIEDYYESKSLQDLFKGEKFQANSLLKRIYPFQTEGVEFVGPKKGCILADEIGTGKTVQSLAAALYKIDILGFEKIKILVPAQLIQHWKLELEKWIPSQQHHNFVLESFEEIKTNEQVDFLIIDEAQKISDYNSSLLNQLHQIDYKQILLITDSKLENSLIKFYAIAGLIDQYLLTPLWELSYKHCLFDPKNPDIIVDYYNLDKLPAKLQDVYIRREKQDVSEQLPEANKVIIPIALNSSLIDEQSEKVSQVINLANKKRPSSYDLSKSRSLLIDLLSIGKFTSSSSFIENESPKLKELGHFISHKLNLAKGELVIIFADDSKIQQQIKILLQNERKRVEILSADQEEFDESIQFFITQEKLQNNLPQAHHYIYFHLQEDSHVIVERSKILKELSGIQQIRFYLLLSSQSLENIVYLWQESKPYFLNQLVDYLTSNQLTSNLNLRLQEELFFELKKLIVSRKVKKEASSETQMDLFGMPDVKEKKKANIRAQNSDTIEEFFQSMTKSFEAFSLLDKTIQKSILKGNFNISEEADEITIKIKK